MSGRDIKKLNEVATIIVGLAFKSKYFNVNGDGIRLVRGVNITNRKLRWGNDTRWWDNLSDDLNRYYLKDNDIVIGMDGSLVGKNYAKISLTDLPLLLVQRVACVRAKEGIYPQFIWYCISNSRFENYIDAVKTGTTIPHISSKQIGEYSINLPCYEDQKKIAAILSSLDDKIELNTRMNNVLEEIARALFRRWFVEFEFPNAEGEPYKSAGGKMVESEMGMVPEGWEVGTIGDIANVIDCLHSKKPDRCETGKPLLQLNNIRDDGLLDMSDIFFISESDYAKWISRCEASQGDCVITNVGRVGAIAQIPEGVKAALGRNMTCVRCKATLPYPTFLLECLLSDTMRLEIINKTDSGTILDSLNVRSIPKLRIVLPDRPTIEAFERIARPIRYNMELNMRENLSLVSSRDVLLPKLMSGELEV